jgi:hypothetical protein
VTSRLDATFAKTAGSGENNFPPRGVEMKRGKLTQSERNRIRRMTLKGIRQSVIARKLGITAPSISKAQRSMGLDTHLTIPEDEIMRLFREGWGGYRIHRFLKVPTNQIYRVAHEHGFRRTDGVGYPEPHGDIAGFVDALKRRDDHIVNLREKFGLGVCQANRLAHKILGTVRFCPGASKPPLSSNFPQNSYRKRFN